MNISQRKAGAILSYFNLILNSLLGILYTPLMLRLMGQSEYGLYSLVASFVSYLMILDFGFSNAIIRYTAKYRATNDKEAEAKLNGMFLVLYSVIGVIALTIGIVLYDSVGFVFSESLNFNEIEKGKTLLLILIFNSAISFPLGVFGSIITAYEKFIFLRIISITRTILMPCIMIPLLFSGYGSIAMVLVIVTLNILALIFNMYYCFKKLKIKITFKKFDASLLKEIGDYSFFIFINIVIDQAYNNTDQVILGIVSGTIAVSVYAVAMQLYNYYQQFSTAISSVFLPNLTMIVSNGENYDALSEIFVRIGRIQFLVLSFVLCGFILFGKEFIILWAGTEYISSYYICLIIMIPAIIPLSQNIGISILQAKYMHQFRAFIYLFIAILNLIISLPLAKIYGGIGAAIGTSIAIFLGQICIMNWFYYKKVGIDIPEYWRQVIKLSYYVLFPLLFGCLINWVVVTETSVYLMAKITIFSVVFMIFMWRYALNDYEKGLFLPIIRKIHQN